MKHFILALILLSPFLVCDPQAGVQTYQISGDTFFTAPIPAQSDGSLRVDVATIPNGPHALQVRACAEPWGCSSPTPFAFTRPNITPALNLKLVAQ